MGEKFTGSSCEKVVYSGRIAVGEVRATRRNRMSTWKGIKKGRTKVLPFLMLFFGAISGGFRVDDTKKSTVCIIQSKNTAR